MIMRTKNKMTFKEIRSNFWDLYPEFQNEYRCRKKQNEYNATIRTAFVDYIDHLAKDGIITNNQAYRITL